MNLSDESLHTQARDIIFRARMELGNDLDGGSLTDLLLDNLPLSGVVEARALLRAIGEQVPQ